MGAMAASRLPAGQFRLLLDANAFIALEPTSTAPEAGLAIGAELLNLAAQGGHRLHLQAAIDRDFARDRDVARRETHRLLARKYDLLGPVSPSADLLTRLAETTTPDPASHDGVDLEFLATLDSGAVDYLVSDDVKLRKRALRAGLGEFVVTLAEAVSLLRNLRPADVPPPPAVELVKAFQLDIADPIFRSLRTDYRGFDSWFDKVRREHREAWVIREGQSQGVAAIMIVKPEATGEHGLTGSVLKISTFKVAEEAMGRKYGELLLKTLFGYAHAHSFDTLYVTAFEKHAALIGLLETFGFEILEAKSGAGEAVLVKRRRPIDLTVTDFLTTHRRHGPPYVDPRSPVFVVPIQPTWHELLFPDYGSGLPIWTGEHPYGNALRKAYVSASPSHQLAPGSTVLFYRSTDFSAITVVGVVDDVLIAAGPDEVVRFVGRRTVYTVEEIKRMAARAPRGLQAVLFRQDRLIQPAWHLDLLRQRHVLRSWPQSITRVPKEGETWVHQQLAESH